MPRAALSPVEITAFRERIREAAARLFAEAGYPAVTLRAIADQLVGAIRRAELFAQIEALAYTDSLTGVASRRAVERALEEACGEPLGPGMPALVLDTPVAREVYGPAVRYVSHLEPDAIGDALVDLLTNANVRDTVMQHRETVLARYSWERAANATLRALEEAAGA